MNSVRAASPPLAVRAPRAHVHAVSAQQQPDGARARRAPRAARRASLARHVLLLLLLHARVCAPHAFVCVGSLRAGHSRLSNLVRTYGAR